MANSSLTGFRASLLRTDPNNPGVYKETSLSVANDNTSFMEASVKSTLNPKGLGANPYTNIPGGYTPSEIFTHLVVTGFISFVRKTLTKRTSRIFQRFKGDKSKLESNQRFDVVSAPDDCKVIATGTVFTSGGENYITTTMWKRGTTSVLARPVLDNEADGLDIADWTNFLRPHIDSRALSLASNQSSRSTIVGVLRSEKFGQLCDSFLAANLQAAMGPKSFVNRVTSSSARLMQRRSLDDRTLVVTNDRMIKGSKFSCISLGFSLPSSLLEGRASETQHSPKEIGALTYSTRLDTVKSKHDTILVVGFSPWSALILISAAAGITRFFVIRWTLQADHIRGKSLKEILRWLSDPKNWL